MRDSFIENFEQSVVDAMEKNKVPGMAASILIDREVAYCRAWGVSRHGDRSAPMTPDTVCAVMSVAKGFTATAVMQLVENGARCAG